MMVTLQIWIWHLIGAYGYVRSCVGRSNNNSTTSVSQRVNTLTIDRESKCQRGKVVIFFQKWQSYLEVHIYVRRWCMALVFFMVLIWTYHNGDPLEVTLSDTASSTPRTGSPWPPYAQPFVPLARRMTGGENLNRAYCKLSLKETKRRVRVWC